VKHDDLNPHNTPASLPEQAAAGASGLNTPEREIPVVPAPPPVHRWLDGESVQDKDLTQPEAEKHVKFWAKVNNETERRHRMKTPIGLDAIIMEKLEPPVAKDD
jgi:hypothetical protein